PRPAGALVATLAVSVERTNATRDPSGDGTIEVSAAGVVHTADAALPSIGTRQRSPFFATMSARPSVLQNAPFNWVPAALSSCGAAATAPLMEASATCMLATPARSHMNTTCRPSGDHIGDDGCRMSMS